MSQILYTKTTRSALYIYTSINDAISYDHTNQQSLKSLVSLVKTCGPVMRLVEVEFRTDGHNTERIILGDASLYIFTAEFFLVYMYIICMPCTYDV